MKHFDKIVDGLRSFKTTETGCGIDEDEIFRVEKTLDIKITGSYRKFLRKYGWVAVECIEIFGLGADVPKHLNIEKITHSERFDMVPSLDRSLLPLMNDGSGNFYCLNCQNTNSDENTVVFWDHEKDSNQKLELVEVSFSKWFCSELEQL